MADEPWKLAAGPEIPLQLDGIQRAVLDLQSGDRIEVLYEDSPARAICATISGLFTDQEEGMGIEVQDYTACWIEIVMDDPEGGRAKQVILLGTDFQYRLNGRRVSVRMSRSGSDGNSILKLPDSQAGDSMEFTDEGLKLVKTVEFAQMVDDYLSPWRERKVPESDLTKLLAAVIGWAATGHAVQEPPAGRQSYEMAAFILSHAGEIDDLCGQVGGNIFALHARHSAA